MPLKHHEYLFRLAFDALSEPLMLVGGDRSIAAVNRAFEVSTGLLPGICRGRPIDEVCRSVEGGEPLLLRSGWEGIAQCQCHDGSFKPFGIRITELRDETVQSFLLSFTPGVETQIVTESGSFQQRKLESLGVLASSVAHDLNNILTGVLGHVSFLRLSLPPAAAHRESITAIEDGARRAASITQQILEFARGREVELCTVNLSLVIAAGINLLRRTVPSGIRMKFEGGKTDVFVYGDEGQLSQLVMNLLVNACDALPNGGTIELSVARVRLEGADADGRNVVPGDYVKLCIRDNGQGIPAEIQDRIFEPFFTTKEQRGTGLGLATVYSIVKAHRGEIRVESKEGEGTCFEVFLPGSDEEQAVAEPEASEIPRGSEQLMVVDDEEAVRTVMQRSLEHLGYRVLVAKNGVEALEVYQAHPQQICLVILDMIMPQMSGDELFYKLKELDPQVGVLIASGYSSDARTKAILQDGALGFIQKPFDVEELAQEVRTCLDKKRE
ncbi:MAG: response regulator [Bdellovibrionales bacterium]|nr:response regulator [Bdellovibrionales bacterium]